MADVVVSSHAVSAMQRAADRRRSIALRAMLRHFGIALRGTTDDAVLAAYEALHRETGLHPLEAWRQWCASARETVVQERR